MFLLIAERQSSVLYATCTLIMMYISSINIILNILTAATLTVQFNIDKNVD